MDWTDRIRIALSRDTSVPDADVVEELAQHAQATYAAARADGASLEEAEAQVAALIDRWRARALHHRRRRPAVVEAPAIERRAWGVGLFQDVRYALRLIARQPRQAALTILTLALGIAATTMLFTVASREIDRRAESIDHGPCSTWNATPRIWCRTNRRRGRRRGAVQSCCS